MTLLQKATIGGSLAVAIGMVIYQVRQVSLLRPRVHTLRQQVGSLAGQIEALLRERDDARSQSTLRADGNDRLKRNSAETQRLRAEVTRLRHDSEQLTQARTANTTNGETQAQARAWHDRVRQLKQYLETHPELRIPEFQLLTEEDWLDVTREDRKSGAKPDLKLRLTMSELRGRAQQAFGLLAHEALKKYVAANNGNFPTDPSQLKSYFEAAPDDAILQRFKITSSEYTLFQDGWGKGKWVLTQKALVDHETDYSIGITLETVACGRR